MKHASFQKNIKFNKIIILDCLSDNEYQTAIHLHENLSDKGYRDGISYIKIQDSKSIREAIDDIRFSISDMGFRPIIHIEAHGNPESMVLPDKSSIQWGELANEFRKINQLMGNELVTFIGTCHGYHFIFKNHTINNFTPVYFCIAPLDSIPAGDVEDAAFAFYESVLLTGDLTQSANLLDSSKLYTYNSDYMFHRAFHEAMQRNHKGKAFQKRKEALITQAISLMGDAWKKMNPTEKRNYLKRARQLLNDSLKSKESLRKEFDRFSIGYMGYANEQVFDEIWKHMQDNKQGRIF